MDLGWKETKLFQIGFEHLLQNLWQYKQTTEGICDTVYHNFY